MKLHVYFELLHMTHPLAEFQKAGHFVPGMVDSEQRRREWEGETVHVLELKHNGLQVLRVLADSQAEAERLMELNIMGTLLAHAMAQQQTAFSYDQMKRLVDRAAMLQTFLDNHPLLKHGPKFEDVFAAALYYMEKATKGE